MRVIAHALVSSNYAIVSSILSELPAQLVVENEIDETIVLTLVMVETMKVCGLKAEL